MALQLSAKTILAMVCVFLASACSKEIQQKESDSEIQNAASSSNNGTLVHTTTFGPVTTSFMDNCWENIRFGGTIEERVHKSTDGNGNVHYVRSFNAKGMTGTGMSSGLTYVVVGGNEMFSIKNPVMSSNPLYPNVPASIASNGTTILIHQGTLVFERSDGARIVARHIIRKTPGGSFVSHWVCGGN